MATENEIQDYIENELDKVMRLRYVCLLVPMLLAVVIKFYLMVKSSFESSLVIEVLGYIYPSLVAFSAFYLLYWYLQTGFKDKELLRRELTSSRKNNTNSFRGEGAVTLDELHREISDLKKTSATHAITHELKEKILADTEEAVMQSLKNNLEENIREDDAFDNIEVSRAIVTGRIESELERLIRSSSINLSAGVLIASLGILALCTFVFPGFMSFTALSALSAAEQTSASGLVAHYAPRFSLVISIEILAFFFLRLHRSNLYEIKYYQNELTNLELKYVSLQTAIQLGRNDTTHKVVSVLSETERNHILEKGQSTTELKRVELEKNQFIEIAKSLTALAPKSK